MLKKSAFLLIVTLVAATVLIAGAGAVVQPVKSPGIDLSNRAAVAKYLASLGIDSKGVVVQRGKRNYAGPSCPGVRWTCTSAKVVLQFGPNNQFECTPSVGGSATAPDTCKIVQFSTGADNRARCVERTGAASVSQSCLIYQTNTTGTNRADVIQQVNANAGASQSATQYAGITQTNGSGKNDANVNQDLKQSTKDTGLGGTQTQDGHQTSSILQNNDTGENDADVHQSLALKARASDLPSITQNQDTDGMLNTSSSVRQFSTSGRNDAHVDQSNDLDASAAKADTASQTQGSATGGLYGHFEQDSTGLSTVKGMQHEHQDLHADHVVSLTQVQYGPAWWGSEQGSNPADRYDIDQNSVQHADDPSAFQSNQEYANCDTSGECTATQSINQNGEHASNSCTGSSCHIGVTETSDSEGTSTFTCPDPEAEVGCPTPPPPPPPPPPPGCTFSC